MRPVVSNGVRLGYVGLLALGCVLLGFSTEPSASVGVQAFGLPFFALSCLLATGVFLLSVHRRTVEPAVSAFLLLLCAVVAWMCITSLVSPYPWVSLSRVMVNLIGLVTTIGVVCLAEGSRRPADSWRVPAGLCVCATTVIATYFLINLLQKSLSYGFGAVIVERFVGGLMSLPWGASNNIASVLLFGLGLSLLLRRSLGSVWMCLLIVVHLAAIFLTFSRNGLFCAVLMVMLGLRARGRLMAVVAASVLLSLVMGSDTSWMEQQGVVELLDRRVTGGSDLSDARVDIWVELLRVVAHNPFQFTGYYSTVYVHGISAHNFALNTLLEQGPLGLLLALALLIRLYTLSYRSEVSFTQAQMTFRRLWLVMTLNLTFEDSYFSQPFILVFWLTVASQVLLRIRSGDPAHAAT